MRGGGQNLVDAWTTISCTRLHIFVAVFGGGSGGGQNLIDADRRYPESARARVRKIGEYPGPSQHLRQPAVVVDASFFVHAAHNCG